MADNTSIADAVNAANASIVEEENKAVGTQTEEVKKEETQVEEAPEVKEEEVKLDQRTTQALQILELLESPADAKEFITQLALKAGIINSESTKAEVKQATKNAAEVLKEKLGDNYEFLSGPIGDALTEILGSQQKEFQQQLLERDQKVFQAEFAREYTEVTKDLKITDKEAILLNERVQKYPNYGTVPLKEYLGDMLKLVRGEQQVKSEQVKTRERQKENLKERLPSGTEVVEAKETTKVDKRGHMTPKEAILMAQRQLQGN